MERTVASQRVELHLTDCSKGGVGIRSSQGSGRLLDMNQGRKPETWFGPVNCPKMAPRVGMRIQPDQTYGKMVIETTCLREPTRLTPTAKWNRSP